MNITRRSLLAASAGVAAGASVSVSSLLPKYQFDRRPERSRVVILRVDHYAQHLEDLLDRGLRVLSSEVAGQTVLLKPNLVDYLPNDAVNTHPSLILAAAACFRRRGAKSVAVADGPGHQRDTQLVLRESGYEECLRSEKIRFVDLNRDQLVRRRVQAGYTALKYLWLPRTILEADFLVSMPKIKVHHWSGVTLSMKNMFGVVPGARYGWPKNILHWMGIQESILDVCATVPVHCVIADGVIAMEGNGPLNGAARHMGSIVLSNDPVAADATCARLMGFEPNRIPHIREASRFLGNSCLSCIEQVGETLSRPAVPYQVVADWEYLRSAEHHLRRQ